MLANKAVVVPVALAAAQATAVARRLAAEGAAIVLVTGEDDVEAGRMAADLAPARTAVFVLTSQEAPDLDALVELLAELFP